MQHVLRISRKIDYGLRAMIYLASISQQAIVPFREIARQMAVPEDKAGMAAGIVGTAMAIGIAFGSALVTGVLSASVVAVPGSDIEVAAESLYGTGYWISVGLATLIVVTVLISRVRNGRRVLADGRSAVRDRLHEPLGLELREGLPYRRRADAEAVFEALTRAWPRRIPKREAVGIHGILFYQLYAKRKYYPTLRDEEAVNPGGSRLR